MSKEFNILQLKESLKAHIDTLSGDYIIVPRGAFLPILEDLNEASLVNFAKLIGAPSNGDIQPVLDIMSPNVHLQLRAFRRRYRITQKALASASKLKQPDISTFERKGRKGFGQDRLQRLIDAAVNLAIKKEN